MLTPLFCDSSDIRNVRMRRSLTAELRLLPITQPLVVSHDRMPVNNRNRCIMTVGYHRNGRSGGWIRIGRLLRPEASVSRRKRRYGIDRLATQRSAVSSGEDARIQPSGIPSGISRGFVRMSSVPARTDQPSQLIQHFREIPFRQSFRNFHPHKTEFR